MHYSLIIIIIIINIIKINAPLPPFPWFLRSIKSWQNTSLNIHWYVIKTDVPITNTKGNWFYIIDAAYNQQFSQLQFYPPYHVLCHKTTYCFIPLILLTCHIYEKLNNYFFGKHATKRGGGGKERKRKRDHKEEKWVYLSILTVKWCACLLFHSFLTMSHSDNYRFDNLHIMHDGNNNCTPHHVK